MPRPTPFDRRTSFTQLSSNYPTKPQPGSTLDVEFNAVKISLDETQANLALIQDDDGKLKRGSIGRAQLDSSIALGFQTPKSWTPNTSYEADVSTVFYQARFYSGLTTHVSGTVFEPEKWYEIADLSTSAAIDPGSITEDKLADGAVTAAKIGGQAVTASKLGASAVTTAKLIDEAVTLSKLASSLPRQLADLIIPVALGPLPYSGPIAPDGWVFTGADYPRADFPALWAHAQASIAAGDTMFTNGNGATTFGIASMTGRNLVGVDPGQSVITGALKVGDVVGASTTTLLTANLPPYTPTGIVSAVQLDYTRYNSLVPVGSDGPAVPNIWSSTSSQKTTQQTPAFTGTPQGGNSTPISRVQPGVVTKFIMKAH